jgi:hypothetical protein
LKRRNSNPTGRTDGPRKGATKLKLLHHAQGRNLTHGAVMAVQAATHPQHISHLWGDVPALFVVAGVLAFLMPRGSTPVVQGAAYLALDRTGRRDGFRSHASARPAC